MNLINITTKIVLAAGLALVAGACKKDVFQHREKAQTTLSAGDGRLAGNTIHLYGDTAYIINTNLVIGAGKTLLIDAGTLVKVGNRFAIDIEAGGIIDAQGTPEAPIVFTSAAQQGGAGVGTGLAGGERFWYGLRIYGNANNPTPAGSGVLKYVRIEFAGGFAAGSNSSPSLLLEGVTNETEIHHIQVSYSFTQNEASFKIAGGDVNAHHLVSYAAAGTDFLLTDGYTGKLQHLLAWRHPWLPIADGVSSTDIGGLVVEGAASFPFVSNCTVIGPNNQSGISRFYGDTIARNGFGRRVAPVIVKGGRFQITNSAFMGFPYRGFYLDNRNSAISLNDRESLFTHNVVHAVDSAGAIYLGPTVFPPFTSKDLRNLMMLPEFGNQQVLQASDFLFANAYDYDVDPDPFPLTGSLLLSGAVYEGAFKDPFFNAVNWRGAIGADNWLQGWTNLKPLQTNYNNY